MLSTFVCPSLFCKSSATRDHQLALQVVNTNGLSGIRRVRRIVDSQASQGLCRKTCPSLQWHLEVRSSRQLEIDIHLALIEDETNEKRHGGMKMDGVYGHTVMGCLAASANPEPPLMGPPLPPDFHHFQVSLHSSRALSAQL